MTVLPPGGFIWIALLLGYLTLPDWNGAFFFWSLAGLAYIFATPMFAVFSCRILERGLDLNAALPAVYGDVVVWLGEGAPMIKSIAGPPWVFGGPCENLHAAFLLHRRFNCPVILSGGQAFAQSGIESDLARQRLIEWGVDPDSIYTDTTSVSTVENAKHTKSILEQHSWTRPFLVASSTHLSRAADIFRRLKIEVVPVAGRRVSLELQNTVWPWVPSILGLSGNTEALKELILKLLP